MSGFAAEPQVLTVSQLNQYLKSRFDADPYLGSVAVRGEISNYKKYPSGHHYFSLKDPNGVLSCVMFRSSAQHLRFRPENGMQVVAFGRVTVFPRDGRYQLYVDLMTADGVGDLHVAFEQLKQKLEAEGLFAPEHKKPIPACPKRVALITSGAGAAVRDMIRILGAPVAHDQGAGAAGTGPGGAGPPGDDRSPGLCQPLAGGRPHHYWPGRRFH